MRRILIISSTVTYPVMTWGHERVYNVANELGKRENVEVRVYVPYVRRKNRNRKNQVTQREYFVEYMQHTPVLQILDMLFSRIMYPRRIYSIFVNILSSRSFFQSLLQWSDEIIYSRPDLIWMVQWSNKPLSYLSHNIERTMVKNKNNIVQQKKKRELMLCHQAKKIYVCSEQDKEWYIAEWVHPNKIFLLPNGKSLPKRSKEELISPYVWEERTKIIFVWSSHWPNKEWLSRIHEISKKHLNIVFIIVWSVWVWKKDTDNVLHVWFVSEQEKSQYLYYADWAINPIWSGWGSSLKVVDYIMHGLPIISTDFWMRGFEECEDYVHIDKSYVLSLHWKNKILLAKKAYEISSKYVRKTLVNETIICKKEK